MSKSDVEMEDAEKLHNDSGNNVQESECKVIDPKVECEEEGPCAASACGDLNGGENDGEDMNKFIDEVKDKKEVKTEAEDQTKPVNGASEPIKESDCGITITKSDNKEPRNTETPAEAQSAATSAVEKLCDVKNEVVEHDVPDSGVKEDELTKNDVVNENRGKDVEERPNEDILEKPEDIAKDTCNTEYAGSELMVKDVEERPNEDIVEKPEDIAKDTCNTEYAASESMVKDVEERPNEDIMVKPEDIAKDTCNTEYVASESMVKDAEERPNEDIVEKPEDIANDTRNTEYVAIESMVKDVEERPNEDIGEKPEDIAKDTYSEYVASESMVKDAEERPNEDIVEKPEDIANDTCNTEYVATESMVKDVEERPNEDIGEKPEDIAKDTYTEFVASESMMEKADSGNVSSENKPLPIEISATKDTQGQEAKLGDVRPSEDEEMEDAVHFDKKQAAKSFPTSHETDGDEKTFETVAKPDAEESSLANQHEPVTPNDLARCSSEKNEEHSGETAKSVYTLAAQPFMGEDDDGTPEDQAAFMKALEHFYRERAMDFKPPKFYGHPLNCLKLWRAIIRLGGYDRVTGSKLWRQVGESFHPPKTCTTVSWTFRIFYEKSLLEFERHKTHSGELQLPIVMLPEVSGADVEGNGFQGSGSGSGPGRARRDSATRAMQGWHAQRLGAGEVGDPIIKEKNLNSMAKNEKNLKSISSLKQKRPNEVEQSNKAARTDISKQLVASVVDVGPPADWVKINVRQTKDCFEVYALVPGLLREEVRVQSDPAGRLVITGQPEQVDNPWGITPFKKIINLPARIHPVQTSAVVSLHGRLYVRVPFEQPNI